MAKQETKEVKKEKDLKLPEGITKEMLKANWDTATMEYVSAFRRARLLDAADRGRLWAALKGTFPSYQILADTNHVAYVKSNLVAGVYSVSKSPQLLPTTKEDLSIVTNLNIFLEHIWDTEHIGHFQMRAGDRAALTNMGLTQVGWDNKKKKIALKNIDPMQFMRDPYAETLEESAYCMTWFTVHRKVLEANPRYKQAMKGISNIDITITTLPVEQYRDGPSASAAAKDNKYPRVIIHWIRIGDDYYEIHTLDNEHILDVTPKLSPAMFPFADLYCNLPAGDLIGTSECAKIFANSVAYNLNHSLLLSAEYRNQHPAKFISQGSGLNIPTFLKHGNDAGYTFIVAQNAAEAVHYQQYPQVSPGAAALNGTLTQDIYSVSGVDPRYTGRDSGSILTTGGMEAMLDQVTMIDAPKIVNYEMYVQKMTKLILKNLLKHAPKRTYAIEDKVTGKIKPMEVDFPNIANDTLFDYSINISSELPKTKARIAQVANQLMEKQMQYGQGGMKVDFIVPEEWLMMQDIPHKELFQERMKIQRTKDYVETVTEALFAFGALTKEGLDPSDAITAVAAQMEANETAGGEDVELPAVAAGIPQDGQGGPPPGPQMPGPPPGMPGPPPGAPPIDPEQQPF